MYTFNKSLIKLMINTIDLGIMCTDMWHAGYYDG